jgi:hypothetical protein
MFNRRQEQETFPTCLEHGIGVMGYGSLGHGLLTGAFTTTTSFGEATRDWRGGGVAFGQPIFRGDNFKTNVGVVERIRNEIAAPRGVSVSQVALAWVLGHPAISTALVGARTRGGGRQRRRRRAGALGGRARPHRHDPRGRGGSGAGVHAAAARDGTVGRGDPGALTTSRPGTSCARGPSAGAARRRRGGRCGRSESRIRDAPRAAPCARSAPRAGSSCPGG